MSTIRTALTSSTLTTEDTSQQPWWYTFEWVPASARPQLLDDVHNLCYHIVRVRKDLTDLQRHQRKYNLKYTIHPPGYPTCGNN